MFSGFVLAPRAQPELRMSPRPRVFRIRSWTQARTFSGVPMHMGSLGSMLPMSTVESGTASRAIPISTFQSSSRIWAPSLPISPTMAEVSPQMWTE